MRTQACQNSRISGSVAVGSGSMCMRLVMDNSKNIGAGVVRVFSSILNGRT